MSLRIIVLTFIVCGCSNSCQSDSWPVGVTERVCPEGRAPVTVRDNDRLYIVCKPTPEVCRQMVNDAK